MESRDVPRRERQGIERRTGASHRIIKAARVHVRHDRGHGEFLAAVSHPLVTHDCITPPAQNKQRRIGARGLVSDENNIPIRNDTCIFTFRIPLGYFRARTLATLRGDASDTFVFASCVQLYRVML